MEAGEAQAGSDLPEAWDACCYCWSWFLYGGSSYSQRLHCWLLHLAPQAPHDCQVTRAARNVLQHVCTHAGASGRGTLRVDGMHRAQHRGQTSEGRPEEWS